MSFSPADAFATGIFLDCEGSGNNLFDRSWFRTLRNPDDVDQILESGATLVAADWLDEHGENVFAEFIRKCYEKGHEPLIAFATDGSKVAWWGCRRSKTTFRHKLPRRLYRFLPGRTVQGAGSKLYQSVGDAWRALFEACRRKEDDAKCRREWKNLRKLLEDATLRQRLGGKTPCIVIDSITWET